MKAICSNVPVVAVDGEASRKFVIDKITEYPVK